MRSDGERGKHTLRFLSTLVYRVSRSLGFVLLMLVDIYVMILISTIPSDPNIQERSWPNPALGPRSSRMESS